MTSQELQKFKHYRGALCGCCEEQIEYNELHNSPKFDFKFHDLPAEYQQKLVELLSVVSNETYLAYSKINQDIGQYLKGRESEVCGIAI